MVVWRVPKGAWVLCLGLPLLACGGKSLRPEPSIDGSHGGAGGNEAGGAWAGVDDPELGGASDVTSGGRASGGTQASGGSSAGAAGGPTAGRVEAAGGGRPTPADAGSAGTEPGGDCSGELCRLSVDPAPRWVTKLKGYGRGPA